MSAVNYARNDRLGRYVFLAEGEKPDPQWLEPDWAWHDPPTPKARKIGETFHCVIERRLRGEGRMASNWCPKHGHAPATSAGCALCGSERAGGLR